MNAVELVAELHRRQEEMYAGGPVESVDGSAVLDGQSVSWKTIGVYRVDVEHRQIREVWLVPLDSELFDRIWSEPRSG